MHRNKNTILLLAIVLTTFAVQAQKLKRLQPGKLYEEGEAIYAPKYGFNSVIPEGWEGTLPRDMEIFLLMPDSIDVGGELYTFASEKKDLKALRENWMAGAKLSESITIKAARDVVVEGDMISSEVIPAGENVNTGNKGFVAAKCSPFGPCITCLAIGPTQFYDQLKSAVERFMGSAQFSRPSDVSIYVDFDWKEFLTDKMLLSFLIIDYAGEKGKKENTFHLCKDGTFTGDIKKTGIMKKANAQYKGNQSGKWSTESIGEKGVLTLLFEKAPPVEISMTIKDEKIFINDERYFVADSDKCRK